MKKKKQLRIVLGINSLTESQWPAYNSHLGLFYRLGKDNPEMELLLYNPSRVGIDKMRNGAAACTVGGGFDYLLFLDDDVVPQSNSLERLIACDADVAAGDVIIRGYPFDHMCFRYTDHFKNNLKAIADFPEGHENPYPVDAVGCSLTLIKRELLEELKPPYFITGGNHTEDIYFCIKARDAVPNCSIVVDTKLTTGHILWPEIISSVNKEAYKEYFEKMNPHLIEGRAETSLEIKRVSSDTTYEDVA